MKCEPAHGGIYHVHLRKVLPQSANEVSSENTPQRQAAALPCNHGNAVVRWPADQLDRASLVVYVCNRSKISHPQHHHSEYVKLWCRNINVWHNPLFGHSATRWRRGFRENIVFGGKTVLKAWNHYEHTWVMFWGEFQFVRKLHGSCCGVNHVHQNWATAITNKQTNTCLDHKRWWHK